MARQSESFKGSLSRVSDELITPKVPSIFTLSHWRSHNHSERRKIHPVESTSSRRRRGSAWRLRQPLEPTTLHAIREASLAWLLRWTLLACIDESPPRREPASAALSRKQQANYWTDSEKLRRAGQQDTVLAHLGCLPDRRLSTLASYLFRRWLTWANVLELVLVLVLTCCLVYHSHALLADYYSYPSFVSKTKQDNDNFRKDLPAVTLCSNNRLSRAQIRRHFPQLNETHLKAMELGTFYGMDNFSVSAAATGSGDVAELDLDEEEKAELDFNEDSDEHSKQPSPATTKRIDFAKVLRFMSERRVHGLGRAFPAYDLVASALCYDIWGEPMPCAGLRRVVSHQSIRKCVTLFHETAFGEAREPALLELERAMASRRQVAAGLADEEEQEAGESAPASTPVATAAEAQSLRSGGSAREMIRLRLDFRAEDYLNTGLAPGGSLAIHWSGQVASMSHISHRIEPGHWYSYFVQRTDYKRLPAPYASACHLYRRGPHSPVRQPVRATFEARRVVELAKRQASRPERPLAEYVSSLRERSISARQCLELCEAELSAVKCNCWPTQVPYVLAHNDLVDENRTLAFCAHQALLGGPRGAGQAGDDIQFQVCARHFVPLCTGACPADCSFSSFDSTEQSRAWPSHESLRYLRNPKLIERLRAEAQCCATVSVLYSSLTSDLYATTAKYSRQELAATLSGNVEAWLGVSAAHGYLFLERLLGSMRRLARAAAAAGCC